VKVPPTGPSGRAAAVISILGTYLAQRAAGDGLGPHTAAYRRRIQDHESQAFPHVPGPYPWFWRVGRLGLEPRTGGS
jgi:hypothetical protein